MTLGAGHAAGTAPAESVERQAPARRASDGQSSAHGWPRLMTLAVAARYVSLSEWVLSQFIADDSLPVVRPQRPRTAKAYRPRAAQGRKASRPVGDQLRRVLVDRDDLDALVDRWKAAQ